MLDMRTRILLIFLLFFCTSGVRSQGLTRAVEEMQADYSKGKYDKVQAVYVELLERAQTEWANDPTAYADLLNTVGNLQFTLSQYDSATAYYWTAMESVKTSLGELSFEYGFYSYQLATVYNQTGQYAQAEAWYNYSLPLLAQGYGANSAEYTECFNVLAVLYTDMGRYTEARPMSEAAVYFFRETFGKEDDNYLAAYNNLGRVYQGLGMYDEAAVIFRECLDFLERKPSKHGVDLFVTQNNLAELYRIVGKYELASPLYQKALAGAEKHKEEDPSGTAMVWNNLGLLFKAKGQFTEAERAYMKSLQIYENLGMQRHLDYTNPLNNLGDLCRTLGRQDRAIEAFSKVIALRLELVGEDQPRYANALNNLALVYMDMGSFAEAEKLFLQSLDIYEKSVGATHDYYANCINNLASLYTAAGHYEPAVEMFEAAVVIYGQSLGKEHESYALYQSSLGEVQSLMGDHEAALKNIREALQIVERKMGTNYPGYTDIRVKLGQALRAAGEWSEAAQLFTANLDDQMGEIGKFFPVMSEEERAAYFSTVSYRFELFNSFVWDRRMRKISGEGPLLAGMYDFQLATKGILLNELTRTRRDLLESNDAELTDLYTAWQAKRELIMMSYRLSNQERSEAGIDLKALESEAATLEKSLNEKSQKFRTKATSRPKKWKDVRNQLEDGEAALEIIRVQYQHDVWTDTVVYLALLIFPDSKEPELVVIEDGSALETDGLQSYHAAINDQLTDASSYNSFWAPIAAKLGETKRVYCSLDGVYQQLNLYTLKNPTTGKYLVDEIQLHLLTSTRDLSRDAFHSIPATPTATLFGFPDYDLGEQVSTGATTRTGLKSIEDLPGTLDEVNMISQVLTDHQWDVDLFTRKDATENELKNLRSPTILHIATHGFFLKSKYRSREKLLGIDAKTSRNNPMLRSGLLMAGVTAPVPDNVDVFSQEDGILTAYEATGLSLDSTELVVLSACETGLGDVINGEGVYGLQRAFQVAGAKSLVMSLWQVSDDPTRELMTAFYTQWVDHPEAGKQEAFRKAQQQLKAKYPEPYFWGAFILIGE